MFIWPVAKSVIPLSDYRLKITFSTNEIKVFDVKPLIKGSFMGELKNREYFEQVGLDDYTVVWPGGQDLAPDDIYENGVPVTC